MFRLNSRDFWKYAEIKTICVYKAGRMKKRTTRRLGQHMSNIYFELSLMFYISPLHEERLEIAS